MASKEGSSYQNPIRFRNSSAAIIYEKGKKAFENQVPNTYVIDAMGNTYVCTTSKSSKGEPVWSRINTTTTQPVGKYVFINTGKSGTKPITRDVSGKETSYSLPSIINRMNNGRVYDKTSFGSFIFVLLSAVETEQITSPPTGSTVSTINAQLGSSEYDLAKAVLDGKNAIGQMYKFLRVDSNGRSGFGATSNIETVRVIVGRDGLGNPIYGERTVTSPSRVSSLIPPTPSPSGSSNPSSPSGGSGGSSKGSSASPSSPNRTTNSPSTKTVQIKFLPDRNIYNGTDTYSNYQDKPYIEQIITDFDSVNKTRQRIIRRHIFDIIPNSFEFSQLSSTWNEVERSGNYAMVDWSKYNLTKCTFRFLVASRRTDTIGTSSTIVNDGMDVSIDEELENIRAIAGAPYPVVFNNLNKFLVKSYSFPYIDNTRGIQWIINDLSINATRLTPNGRGIAAAEVSITLNEYPVIARDIIPLPPLSPKNPISKQCKPTSKNNFCKPKIIQDTVFDFDYGQNREDTVSYPGAQ